MGTEIATKMIEKGFENTFLLSGGIEQFLEEYTDLVEGTDVPVPKKKIEEEKENKRKEMRKTNMSGGGAMKRHEHCKKEGK